MNPAGDDNQNQPTHEAARVVIPFDIDMTAVERKVEELERRIKALTVTTQNKSSGPTVETPSSPTGKSDNDRDRQLLMVTIQQMQQTLREINQFVQLIYTESING